MRRCLLAAAGLVLLLVGPGRTAEFKLDIKTDAIYLGPQLLGPKMGLDDLKGKVVLLDFWGVNCPPCLAAMPGLARMNEELSAFGLVLVAAHAQQATDEEIKAKALALGPGLSVFQGAAVEGGNDFSFIPHSMVFDHTGKCLFRGAPTDAELQVRIAVGKAIVASMSKPGLKGPVKPLIDALEKGQSPALVLPRAVTLSKTDADARLLVEKLTAQGQKVLEEAEAVREKDAVAAYTSLQRLPVVYKGAPVAVKATQLLTELKKDRGVQTELAAQPSLDAIKKIDAQLTVALARLPNVDPRGADFQKAAVLTLRQMKSALQKMQKTWPEARATAEAVEIGGKYGVTLQ